MKFKHFIALNAMDVITTFIALSYLGLQEMNGMYAYLFQEYGLLPALIAVKVIMLTIMYALINKTPYKSNLKLYKWTYNYNPRQASINIICCMFLLVVINNSYQIIKNVAF